ncbi:ergothioneine biosynthesis protein EgtB [Myxococcota bacterium]|nr:ergothioneine biosynthesis protein EgtB [Myxococcota bacterium]
MARLSSNPENPLSLSHSELSHRYREVRTASEALCADLSAEDCNAQSMPDASPAKWHLAHTSWFFETLVLEAQPNHQPYRPEYRVLFNSYYESVGDQYPRPDRGLLTRPSLEEVLDYRQTVDLRLLECLDAGLEAPALDVVELGIHHEQQHQELLLTDIKHLLSHNPLHPVYLEGPSNDAAAHPPESEPITWQAHAGGLHSFGHAGKGFAFDNEQPRHQVFLEPFELAQRPVTNGDFLAFVEDGGYHRPELWLSDGFAASRAGNWRAPLYWHERDGGYEAFTLSGLLPLVEGEPVCHVSFYEADAFARWSNARLPNEFEWEIAASQVPMEGNFAERGRLHPEPTGSGRGVMQLYGDTWEWTRSHYGAYPGFRPLSGSLGEYNGKFMSGQMVLRGGSCATRRSHIRSTYRNFFPPDARWQFSGIRLARDLS